MKCYFLSFKREAPAISLCFLGGLAWKALETFGINVKHTASCTLIILHPDEGCLCYVCMCLIERLPAYILLVSEEGSVCVCVLACISV